MDSQDLPRMQSKYSLGFKTKIKQKVVPAGLSKDIIKLISSRRNEPKWLLKWRLEAFEHWQKMEEPHWADFEYSPIDYQKISYFAEISNPKYNSLDDVDPEVRKTFDKLGIPIFEQQSLMGIAVDAVVDSVSVATTFQKKLREQGIIFCPISEAVRKYPELVKKYLGSVVPKEDNFFACLNAAVFSDGSFVYVPKGVRCPLDLSSYFRMNAVNVGQFERTLIIAEEGSYVSYLEGCSAPRQSNNQLHAAVVEIIADKKAEVKYSTVQNWYPGNSKGKGGVYNFVTKRAKCVGKNSKASWTQIEMGAAATWKYPSCILIGDGSVGEFYSIAMTKNQQRADTGTKMIHTGSNTRSKIVSKTISMGKSINTYRGMVKVSKSAKNAHNYSSCDSLLFGSKCTANTFPLIDSKNSSCNLEHEATTSKINSDKLNYLMQRGLSEEEAVSLFVTGFSREIIQKLPLEFAIEAAKLLEISFEGSVG